MSVGTLTPKRVVRRPPSKQADFRESVPSSLFEEKPNNFDLIRLVLAVAVIYSHAYPLSGQSGRDVFERLTGSTTAGALAVHGFFILSGYLILKSWLRNPSLSEYLRNRLLRIYPAYFVAFFVSIGMGAIFGGVGPARFYQAIRAVSFERWIVTLQTVGEPPQLTGYVHSVFANGVLNGSMWTLVYEFQCYLAVLVLGILGLASRSWVSYLLFVLCFATFYRGQFHYEWSIQFFTYFLAGMCFYHLQKRVRMAGYIAPLLVIPIAIAAVLDTPLDAVLPFCFTYWLFWLGTAVRPWRWLRADLSYGTYLYGWPIEIALVRFLPGVAPLVIASISVVLALAMASLSWRFVERPALRLKRRAAPDHRYA